MKIVRGTALAAVAALTFAPAAFAQQQNGLVNVAVEDVANDNTVTVQVPIGIAAQVCGVTANVLAQEFRGTDKTACTIDQETAAENNIDY